MFLKTRKKLFFLFAVVLCITALAQANKKVEAASLDDGLAAYYPFNANANDESGNGHDGVVNGASLAADRFGNPNSAYHFDGQDYIKVDMSTEVFYDSFTIGAWVNFDNFNNDYPTILHGEKNNIVFQSLGPIVPPRVGNIVFYQLDGAVFDTNIGHMESYNKMDIGEWYYLTVVRNGLDYTMYKNGEIVAQTTSDNYIPMTGSYITIGSKRDYGGGIPWKGYENATVNGYIDDIRIYDRALSENEIQELYGMAGYCGDGNVDEGEECDDGNFDSGDGCDENCVIEAGEALDPVILIPGLMGSWMEDGEMVLDPMLNTYADLWDALILAGYEPEKTLFAFTYDWRDTIEDNAELLYMQMLSYKILSGSDKVDIVAHSMGGLIAREYIQGSNYENNVDQLIFLATPHKGATEAYLPWEGAEFKSGFREAIRKRIFKQEARHYGYKLFDYIREKISSVGQLLPIYDYLREYAGGEMRIYPDNYPRNQFLEDLNGASLNALNDINITNIIAQKEEDDTFNILAVKNKKSKDGLWEYGRPAYFKECSAEKGAECGPGDGTVPERSNLDFYGTENIFVGTTTHTGVVTDAQKIIIKELTGIEPGVEIKDKSININAIYVRMFSPADFVIINPDGESLGKNFASDTIDREIELSYYSGFSEGPEFASIPNPVYGTYTLRVIGTGEGEYTLSVSFLEDEKEIDREVTRTICPGEIHEYTFIYSEDGTISELKRSDASGFDKLIADTIEMYEAGEIINHGVKASLTARFENLKKKYEDMDGRGGEKACGKWEKTKEFLVKKYIVLRLNMIKAQMEYYLNRGFMSQAAYDLIFGDIEGVLGMME